MNDPNRQKIRDWLKSGEHLPAFFRDFHDQKRVFRFIADRVSQTREKKARASESIDIYEGFDWCRFQIFTIDFFLWYMALHGWTLQRTHKRLAFPDYEQTLAAFEARWEAQNPLPIPEEPPAIE